MPHFHRKTCRRCGEQAPEGTRISATGLCWQCGEEIELANHRQLIAHDGPYFEHWRRRTLAAFGFHIDGPPLEL